MSSPQKAMRGTTFSFGVIPAETALDVEVSIVRLFGPLLVRASSGAGLSEHEQADALTEAIQTISSQPNHIALKAELKEMIATLLRYVGAGGNPSLEMSFFNGKNRLLLEVALEAAKVNFGDFLAGSPSPSPQPGTAA